MSDDPTPCSTVRALGELLEGKPPELRRLFVKTLNLHAQGILETSTPKSRKERVRQAIEESLATACVRAES